MIHNNIELSQTSSPFSFSNKVGRVLWYFFYWILFRPFNLKFFQGWRTLVLKIFGATISKDVSVYASVKIWAPWNLKIGSYSTIGPGVDIYNQGEIVIGEHSIISQKTYLCASTHNYNLSHFPLIEKPITIGDHVWIAADAFIGPGVTIENGAVIGARSSVFENVDNWSVVGGNPAKFIKKRNFKINGHSAPSSNSLKVRKPEMESGS
ncbi:putative colanic acid biosynthesis acetyltransferase [Christiangramia echinicola]|uniref:putative colanic acid biosynthesis acetyltransferase n=1 Tax=Christiangramia echinicola TaxID=279359 RepID=UPI0004058519|nr:putative colanic acid biosynthesis acetyltransferase [Christiangramia echinicola]